MENALRFLQGTSCELRALRDVTKALRADDRLRLPPIDKGPAISRRHAGRGRVKDRLERVQAAVTRNMLNTEEDVFAELMYSVA